LSDNNVVVSFHGVDMHGLGSQVIYKANYYRA